MPPPPRSPRDSRSGRWWRGTSRPARRGRRGRGARACSGHCSGPPAADRQRPLDRCARRWRPRISTTHGVTVVGGAGEGGPSRPARRDIPDPTSSSPIFRTCRARRLTSARITRVRASRRAGRGAGRARPSAAAAARPPGAKARVRIDRVSRDRGRPGVGRRRHGADGRIGRRRSGPGGPRPGRAGRPAYTGSVTDRLPATPEGIARAAELLLAGEVVAFPTDTVYGVGVAASRPDRIDALFALKSRPADRRIPILVADLAQVRRAGRTARTTGRPRSPSASGPGALTLVIRHRRGHAGLPCARSSGHPGAHPGRRADLRDERERVGRAGHARRGRGAHRLRHPAGRALGRPRRWRGAGRGRVNRARSVG